MKIKFSSLKFYLSVLFLYVLIAEVVFPSNKFIPRISILQDSFLSLFSNYSMIENLLSTFSTLLIGVLIGTSIFSLFQIYFSKFLNIFSVGKYLSTEKIFFVFILIAIYLISSGFKSLLTTSLLTSVFIFFFVDNIFMRLQTYKQYSDYLKLASQFNKSEKEKNIIVLLDFLPNLKDKFSSLYYSTFIFLIIYEYIDNNFGLGYVINHLLSNNDLSGLVALIIFIGLFFAVSEKLFLFLLNRIIFWDSFNE